MQEEFEDTKGVIIIHISKKNRQHKRKTTVLVQNWESWHY
jgi:hypothetical protein